MFVVIFEVQPKKERWNDYLDLAKYLKPKLEAIEGFIDNERFESKRMKGRLLSLSTWRDEKAVVRWRTQGDHHGVQEKGRFEIFEDYHLRVGEVTRDSDPPGGLAVAQQRFDETANPVAKAVSITEISPSGPSIAAEHLVAKLGLAKRAKGLVDHEIFESIYNPGKLLLLATWRDAEAAKHWTPEVTGNLGKLRHRRVRVIRDYSMNDRHEAPQFYPGVTRAYGVAAELKRNWPSMVRNGRHFTTVHWVPILGYSLPRNDGLAAFPRHRDRR
jgi:heme-degrading monooxygenase HmoA